MKVYIPGFRIQKQKFPRFWIPPIKICRIQESGFPYMGQSRYKILTIHDGTDINITTGSTQRYLYSTLLLTYIVL